MSSQIRRSIGIARKQLLCTLQTCNEDLQSDLTEFLQTASNDELLDYAELNASHHESISTKILKLEDLNNKWTALKKEDANEVSTFHDFISKYGDYRTEIEHAIDILRRLDQHNILLQEEFQKRGITHQSAVLPIQKTTPKSTSENMKSTHTISFASSSQQSPFFSTSAINDHLQSITNDNPTLNYFDASLLTRLELPSFAGNMLEFPEFWARYRALIHCKNTISDTTKFSLLKSCLKGRALHAIDGLPITNENYAAAIDILLSIYDNPSTLHHLIYTQLQSLPQCDSDGKQLQELYLAMLRLVRQYTAITPDSPEFGLGALLYNKLPRFVKARIYDITGGQKKYRPTHSLDRSSSCPFCKRSSHSAVYCRTVKSPQERRKFAKASKLCLKCLRQGHQTIRCTRPPCHHQQNVVLTLPVQPNSKFCNEKCNCPKWTTTCSHYDGILKETSKYSSIPVSIVMFLPPHVCSFNPSALCSSEQRLGVFHQIQLFDDTLIVVPELHIQSADFLAHDDFYCFNIHGNKTTKPHPSSTTGTPEYCRRHQCRASDQANTFCAYPTPAAVYHHKNISIAIKAWGTTTHTYYPALETSPWKSPTSYTIPRCTTGGVVLETTETFQMVEACSSFTCICISNYSPDTKILLPTSVTLFQHTVKLSAWKDGKQVFANDLACEGKPICDFIE